MRGWAARLFVAMMLAIGLPAVAQARSDFPLQTCVLGSAAGLAPQLLLAQPDALPCDEGDEPHPSGDYWVRSAPLPSPVPFMASVRVASLWQQRTTLYVLYRDGAVRRTGFTSATTAPHLRLGAIIDLPLPEHGAAPPVRLLWHLEGASGTRGLVVNPRLTGHQERAREDSAMIAFDAAFGGLVLGLFLYNLALWRALRQPFQSAYCAMLLCLLLYGLCSSGLLGQLTGLDNNMRLRLNAATLACVAISAVLFARSFFERRVFDRGLRATSTIVMAAVGGSTLIYVFVAPWQAHLLDRLVTASYVLLLALVPLVFVRAWRLGSVYLRLFAMAWGAPIVLGGMRVATALQLVGWNWWIDNSTVPAMALEACLSGLVIGGRIRLISRERDEARQQEILARMLADVDPLTGLLNRRAFLHQAIGRQGEQSLVVIDVDHFKRVNEMIGHDGGDEVLRVVARTLQDGHGPETLVARLGGEEFAILAPSNSACSPEEVLDRLRAARMPFDLAVTASIGSCNGRLLVEADWQSLYRCADRALFEAKAGGRNRAHHAPGLGRAA
jgi:diguanylate cyclase (GGDEF)-like protein